MTRLLSLFALLLTISLPLFAQAPSKKKAAAGPVCPVSGKTAVQTIFAPHKGGRVFFDTEESKNKFTANAATYTGAANFQLVATGQARQVKCPILGKNLGPTAINVGGIGVCCVGCQGKIARMNQAQRLNLMFGANFDKFYVVAKSR